MIKNFVGALVLLAAGCTQAAEPADDKVETSGKKDVALAEVPADVLAAAQAERKGFTALEAQSETRDGRHYYDIEGKLADGSEIEFDIMQSDGRWAVVETQRDIAFADAPQLVRDAAHAKDAAFAPGRVIEATQTDGIVIYEIFGPEGGDPLGRKVEVKWDGKTAEVLTKEWAH